MNRRSSYLLSLTLWLLLLPTAVLAEEDEGAVIGQIIALRGEPSLYRGVKELPAIALAEIHVNESLRCQENQSLKLLFADGSVLVIGPESELHIVSVDFTFAKSRRQLELELVSGQVLIAVAPFLSEQADLILSTPAAHIRINDGTFVAAHGSGDDQSRITVISGQLRLRNLFAEPQSALVVKARYNSVVPSSGDPSLPVLLADDAFAAEQESFRLTLPDYEHPSAPVGELVSRDLATISGATVRLNRRPNLPLYGSRPSLQKLDRVRDAGTQRTPESGNLSIHWQFPDGSSFRENSR